MLFSLLALSAFGASQEGPQAKEIIISKKVFLIFKPEVKKELNITADQESKVKGTFGDSLTVDGDRIMIMLTGDTDFGQLSKDALKPLSEEQLKRLTELWIQSLKGAAVGDDEIAKALELTSEQRKSIEGVMEKAGDEVLALFHESTEPDPSAEKKSREIREKAGEKMLSFLTEDQKKKYEAMKGKEFKFKDGNLMGKRKA